MSFFFSSRRRHTRCGRDWSSDVCSSDLSPARLLMELFKLEAGIDVTMVSYKGAGLALGDLVGGEVDAMFATVPSVSSHLKTGRLRALAITSPRRSAILPRVAALSETYPGLLSETRVGP